MSRKPSFANLRARTLPEPVAAPAPPPETKPAAVPSRAGRKQIAGFFTPEMSLSMHMLARRQDRSLQALMAEAFNDVLRKYGESPVGE
ncbi:ribbon-helix-helix domain-containing protein [Sphingomonas sp. Leaf25]|uniref:ribbon-helix-helix domain-containing protein n=1 Tax=Sphingomonas sp. Leaf25 TaxID=1735692 RepID=UPI0006FF3D18|nr:ribbon-helix-helix domain-containing protein [Sphingomonas sp. Leaf25]KQN04317.1 hypothetical protein ASE78_17260 [Sphingomonas sp. Leaf25]